jgi:hypothetical protein
MVFPAIVPFDARSYGLIQELTNLILQRLFTLSTEYR